MNQNDHLVIMAGGVGSRFWPVSSEALPKQFLDILGCGRTLLQLTVDRFAGVCPLENTWVVTSAQYKDIVRKQLPNLPEDQILLEPARRNTAPCIAYVSWRIKAVNPKATIVVTPSDHLIQDVPTFAHCIQEAQVFASETDAILTLGIKPNHPETGYGYIQADLTCASSRNRHIYRVDAFKEKPSREVAEGYIQQPNYFWNAGIFVWSVSTIINAFRVYQPELSKRFEAMMPVFGTAQEQKILAVEFPQCENISIDYAIMEKAEDIYVYPASFGWSDLGTWSSLRGQLSKDRYGNAVIGDNVRTFESTNCMIYTPDNSGVVVQGLDDYVVVQKDGILLICKLSEEQRIRLFH